MKRTISFLLCLGLMLGAVGCTQQDNQGGAGAGNPPAESSGQSTAAESSTDSDTGSEAGTPDLSGATALEADVVVVGGGGTGVVAALTAADEGKQVILLEKMGYLGGAAGFSGGLVPAAGTAQQIAAGIEDSAEALARDILRPGYYGQRRDLVDLVAANAKDFIEWSEGKGVVWSLQTDSIYYGQSDYRMHAAEGGGAGLMAALNQSAEAHENITIMLETPGTGLITEGGAVVGVTASGKEEDYAITARAVVLATSGFGANREMVERYVPAMLDAWPYVAPGATGEGILWGVELGAGVRNMSAFQAYGPISTETKASLGSAMLDNGGFLVNRDGMRFMDEYTGYSNVGTCIVNQPEAFGWMIWDSGVAAGREATLDAWREAEILVEADSVEALAEATGLPQAALQKEFDLFAQGIADGKDYLDRTMLPSSFTGPYYAVKVTGDFRHTQGGLTINLQGQVVREADGQPIPGLYAGGGVAEGFSSSGGPGYMSGNGLLQAFILGSIAGEQAAAY